MKGYWNIGIGAIVLLTCSAIHAATLPVVETFTGVNNTAGWSTPSGAFVDNSGTGGNPGGWLRGYRGPPGNVDYAAGAGSSGGVFAGNYLANYGAQDLAFSYDFYVENGSGEHIGNMVAKQQNASGANRWRYDWPAFPQSNADGWQHYTTLVNPSWTDSQANSNGWFLEAGGASWATVMQASDHTIYVFGLNGGAPVAQATGLDNVQLAAVPEPASVGVLLVGAIAFVGRRRQRA